MHALRLAVTAKMLAGVIAPAPETAPNTRQRKNVSWHFRTRDVLKPPNNEAGIQPESSHAPRPAEHGDDEPARILGGRAAHPSPVLLRTRVSSGAEKLLEERAKLTVVAQYQGPDRAKADHLAKSKCGSYVRISGSDVRTMQFDSNISKLLIFVGSYVFTSEQNMVSTSKHPNTFGEFEVID